ERRIRAETGARVHERRAVPSARGPHRGKAGIRRQIRRADIKVGDARAGRARGHKTGSWPRTTLASSKALKNGLAAGGSTGSTPLSITLPKTMAPGSYLIGAIADPGNKVSATNESDNTKSFPITVCAPMTAPSLQSPAKGATGVSTTPAH